MSEGGYKYIPHSFTARIAGHVLCKYCGLVSSNNRFTQWAIRMGCDNNIHPNYETERKKVDAFGTQK